MNSISILQALILGIVQGIAEFLPISSSGHLAVLQHLFDMQEVPPLFDVILHLPSLLAVIIFFRKKIARLFAILFLWIGSGNRNRHASVAEGEQDNNFQLRNRRKAAEQATVEDGNTTTISQTETDRGAPAPDIPASASASASVTEFDLLAGSDELGRRTIIAVIVTTIVTGAIGIFTSKLLPDLPIQAVCVGFLVTAVLLIASGIFAKRRTPASASASASVKGITVLQAAIIGVMQGVGTLPGVSRSGSTISGSLFCGVDRAAAGEYSFIVSIPAILAAFVLELRDAAKMAAVGVLPLVVACVACFVAAYASLAWLMKIIKKGKLEWFACYLIPLGIAGLILF